VKYAIAELYLLSGMKRIAFYESYFMSVALPMQNPAFINCFKVYYQNLLTGRKSDLQSKIIKAVNIDRNLDLLADVFIADSTMQSQRIRRLACLNGLRDVYFNKSFDRGAIDWLLSTSSTGDAMIDRVAQNILAQFKRCAPGELMPSMTLTNETQEKWSVDEYNGIPLYLYFFATWSPSSLKELQILERWQEKFDGRVAFVAVAMDDDYMDFRKYLEDHPKQMLSFVYGNADPFIQEKLNLKAIPHQLLIDEQGKIVSDLEAPSDAGFEAMLNRVALKADGKQQHPKTWKDH
jgi:thiol-disulfide isomerase/thioredoxin